MKNILDHFTIYTQVSTSSALRLSGVDIFMSILGYIGAVGIAVFSFPEVIKVFRIRKTSDVNVPLFFLLMVSSSLFYITGFYNLSKESINKPSAYFSMAVAIANVFSFIAPFIVLSYKLSNVLKAKKLNMTEKEYEIHKLNQKPEGSKKA